MSTDAPNPAAQALGKLRWAGTTDTERSDAMRALAESQKTALTPEQRSERAKKAASASAKVRSAKAKKKKTSARKIKKTKGLRGAIKKQSKN